MNHLSRASGRARKQLKKKKRGETHLRKRFQGGGGKFGELLLNRGGTLPNLKKRERRRRKSPRKEVEIQ